MSKRARGSKKTGNRSFTAKPGSFLRWRLALRALRKNLTSPTQKSPIWSSYRDSNHFWSDALREPISAYDFADLLAVHRAYAAGISSLHDITSFRQQVFGAFREGAVAVLPWFIGESPLPMHSSAECSWDVTHMISARLVPL